MIFADESVPDFMEFRRRVERVSEADKYHGVLIKTLYLLAARDSEILTKCTPTDSNNGLKPYGVYLRWKLVDWKPSLYERKAENKVLLIKVAIAKRSKKELTYKVIALPVNPMYEPWTLDIMKFIRDRKGDLSFPLTRHGVHWILRERLGKHIFKRKAGEKQKRVLNPLRHWRITHLAEIYDFDPYDLTVYAGWTFKTGFERIGMSSGQLDSYLHFAWRRYYPKLLKPIAMLA
jgi:hypothetical protein